MMATSVFQTLALRFFNSQLWKVFYMDESAPTHRWVYRTQVKTAFQPLNVIQAVAPPRAFALPPARLVPSAQLSWVVGMLINLWARLKLFVKMATHLPISTPMLQWPRLPSASLAFQATEFAHCSQTHRSTQLVHRVCIPPATVTREPVQPSPLSRGPSLSW